MASRQLKSIAATATETCLDNYFNEIKDIKPLSRDEEVALMARIRNGEPGARELLIKSNLRFVVGVSLNYQHQGLPLSDIINEGNLGLIRATMLFDENKNFKFISYAVWWIRQAILQALADQSRIVRVPINRSGSVYKISISRSKIEQQTRRPAEPAEIARDLGMKEKAVRENMAIANKHVSLDAPLSQNETTGLIDQIHYENQEMTDAHISSISFTKEVVRSLGKLSPRESEIIQMYFGIGRDSALTLDDIGRQLNLTRERIRQIKQRALARLKKDMNLERLQDEH
jgi:RNA polymerase primary sigma factor